VLGTLFTQWVTKLQTFFQKHVVELLVYPKKLAERAAFWAPNSPFKTLKHHISQQIIIVTHSVCHAFLLYSPLLNHYIGTPPHFSHPLPTHIPGIDKLLTHSNPKTLIFTAVPLLIFATIPFLVSLLIFAIISIILGIIPRHRTISEEKVITGSKGKKVNIGG
jgi:hypothetical protein